MIYKKIHLPDNLELEAERYIKQVIDYLKSTETLDVIDEGLIVMLAGSYNQYLKATEITDREGLTALTAKGYPTAHPAVRIAKDAKAACVSIMTNMGITLKSRTKLKAMDISEDDSPLVEFMKLNQ